MKTLLTALTAAILATTPAMAAGNIGIVSFKDCIEESKLGKQEQSSLDSLRKQLQGTLEGTEKELSAIVNKVSDPDYLDSLSEDGEEELKMRYQQLMQERANQQQQFYQILQQAEYKTLQELTTEVTRASQVVAKQKKFDYILRDEAAFYFPKDTDVTDKVVAEMDKNFEQEQS